MARALRRPTLPAARERYPVRAVRRVVGLMRPFDLVEPTTLDEAVTLLNTNEAARPIAGGTALLLLVKAGLFRPEALVSLRRLRADLTGIARQNDGSLRIGAMTSLTELGRSPLVRDTFPVIAQTLRTLSNVR